MMFVANYSTGVARQINYIHTPFGPVAAYVQNETGGGSLYYLATDLLGSITAVVPAVGNNIEYRSYDAWGRVRNPNDWTYNNVSAFSLIDRGYTFHEHLPEFGLINMNGRMYDPLVSRMLSPDPFVQFPDYSQSFNRYSYAMNNPLKYTDPSGEFLGLAMFAMGYLSNSFSNLINGVEKPFSTAYTKTMDGISGMSNCLQFPIYQGDNTTITVGLDPFNIGISANVHQKIGDVTLSVSAGWGYFSSFFANAGISYSSGDWTVGAGIGVGKNYWGWNVFGSWKGLGLGYGQTYYGNAIGPDGISNKQTVGGVSLLFPGGSFRLENDFLAFQNKDRWRSSAWELTIGDFSLGSTIYTNDPEGAYGADDFNLTGVNLRGVKNKHKKGVWNNGIVYSSPLYVGVRIGHATSRIGIDSPTIQDVTQNWVHRNGFFYLPLGYQHYYNQYDVNYQHIYLHQSYYNPFSLY